MKRLWLVALCLVCLAAQKKEPDKVLRAGFISGQIKICVSYTVLAEKPKEKAYGGCHNIVVGIPDDWEIVSVHSFGRELQCYDLLCKLKDGTRRLYRVDLRAFVDNSRNDENVELKFRENWGTIDFVPWSKAR